jgi:hypothetical protein
MRKHLFRYFVECILIFLSVISAFLVDNFQDRVELKEEEFNLLIDVKNDLVDDTVLIQKRIEFGIFLNEELSRLITILEHPNNKDTIDDYILKYSTGLFLNKTTYEGIKNTGGFRFLKDKQLVNELSDYYNNREEWTQYCSNEIRAIDNEIAAYLRRMTRFVDNPLAGQPGAAIPYNIESKSLNGMKGDQHFINLCHEKRTRIQQMNFLMNSLRLASIQLNLKCSKYLLDES